MLGAAVGEAVMMVGRLLGTADGLAVVGLVEGATEGGGVLTAVGGVVGLATGTATGMVEGAGDGLLTGVAEGDADGGDVGEASGGRLGALVGTADGDVVGKVIGFKVGIAVGELIGSGNVGGIVDCGEGLRVGTLGATTVGGAGKVDGVGRPTGDAVGEAAGCAAEVKLPLVIMHLAALAATPEVFAVSHDEVPVVLEHPLGDTQRDV